MRNKLCLVRVKTFGRKVKYAVTPDVLVSDSEGRTLPEVKMAKARADPLPHG